MKRLLVVLMSLFIITGCTNKDIKEDISFDNVIAYEEKIVTIPEEPVVIVEEEIPHVETVSTTTTVPVTTTTTTTTTSAITTRVKPPTTTTLTFEQQIYRKLISYKKIYPTGYNWDNSYFYKFKGDAGYEGGFECAAFAFYLQDEIFGNIPGVRKYDLYNVKVGDIIRYKNNNHSVIVLTRNGNNITVAEANIDMDGYNHPIVLWGRKLSLDEISETFTNYVTRY